MIIEETIGQEGSSRVLIESHRDEYVCVPGEKVPVVDLPIQFRAGGFWVLPSNTPPNSSQWYS